MKAISIALLMAASGFVQAAELEDCGSAIDATVSFMTATYAGNPDDVSVQIVSAKKNAEDQLVAYVLSSAGNHKCALELSPALMREGSMDICQWSLQVVDCDSPAVMKQSVIDEPSWLAQKASAKAWRAAWREGAQKKLENSSMPAETNETK